MKKLRCLVTGGAGFVGSHLCDRLLAEGHQVLALDNFYTGFRRNLAHLENEPRFDVVEHDVTQPFPEIGRFDWIFNLACPASPKHYQKDPISTTLTSFVGTWHALELAEASGARFMQASTSEVYGDPRVHPQPETYPGFVNPIGLRACYDEGKRAAETLCVDYRRKRHVDVRIARIFNTYGPRMHPDDGRVVSNFIVQALRHRPLTVYGDGQQTRSFCFVSDLLAGFLLLMNLGEQCGPINLGNDVEHSMLELAQLVREATGSTGGIVFENLPEDDPTRRRPDLGLARARLGYAPAVDLAEGLRHTVAFFRETLQDYTATT